MTATYWALVENTDWAVLDHAYGPAVDTPAQLRNLVGNDSQARATAIDYLWGVVLHQGTPGTATPIVARVIVGILDDPTLDDQTQATVFGGPVRSARACLIDFLSAVLAAGRPDLEEEQLEDWLREASDDSDTAGDAQDDEAAWSVLFAAATLGCRAIAPDLVEPLMAQIASADPSVRATAADALVKAVSLPNMAEWRDQVAGLVVRTAAEAVTADERCALILSLGDLGEDTSAFLDDESEAVRCCAALAPSQASSPRALDEIISALEHPEAIDGWFAERPPKFDMRPRFTLVTAAISRSGSFDEIATAAAAIAGITSKHGADTEWGPLLSAAFPQGYDGSPLSESQAMYLNALVANADVWDPKWANATRWFRKARLPRDRAECARIAAQR